MRSYLILALKRVVLEQPLFQVDELGLELEVLLLHEPLALQGLRELLLGREDLQLEFLNLLVLLALVFGLFFAT